MLGQYCILDMQEEEYLKESYDENQAWIEDDYSIKEVDKEFESTKDIEKAEKVIKDYFAVLEKGDFTRLKGITLDYLYQSEVLNAEYKDEFMGCYKARLVRIQDNVQKMNGNKYRFICDYQEYSSIHSAFYNGTEKPSDVTTIVEVVCIDGKYLVAGMFNI